jgi:ABC-type multidrug transport system ATPase subunit
MEVQLSGAGKKFDGNWLFRNLNHTFASFSQSVVVGANGSGKSTLLKAIAGMLTLMEGEVKHSLAGETIMDSDVYKRLSVSSPWLELPEDYSLKELIAFQSVFKPFISKYPNDKVLEMLEIPNSMNKPFKHFSSGMKQRVKLGLAILGKSELLLLDEPLTALDSNGVNWYQHLISNHLENRTVIVFSNHKQDEYFFCKKELTL